MADSNGSHGLLEVNCRPNWPRWTCMAGNICGLCSTAIWFIVLLPQVWKNFRRKSVRGLSVLWATANFTASLINVFFVFRYLKLPLYSQISAVYMPVLEFVLLLQFWIYGTHKRKFKIVYSTVCGLIWGALIVVELLLPVQDFAEYAAITLWCIETFPQVILNMRLQSTIGQATGSVLIAMIGKTTDFLATNGLVMPLQYVVMCYFSTAVAYINGLQVGWYFDVEEVTNAEKIDRSENRMDSQIERYVTNLEEADTVKRTSPSPPRRAVAVIRIALLALLTVLSLGCVIGFCLNLNSYYGLFAPLSVAAVLIVAQLHLVYCRSSSFDINLETVN
ncbi:uncharacterized protein LOC127865028 [Dreissena polymorpha]|uniref:Uncharacterized protein n=1 Tax=Dreissena polymorpha TaxID=45954 RepID=A0A9D4MPJ0_DREPO|nr:uncharacterized protein LOC127865028 [Dreissena polymorpha]KAH3880148.1 hypothetical protein DPMN_004061 [Dreissena polymorpha]